MTAQDFFPKRQGTNRTAQFNFEGHSVKRCEAGAVLNDHDEDMTAGKNCQTCPARFAKCAQKLTRLSQHDDVRLSGSRKDFGRDITASDPKGKVDFSPLPGFSQRLSRLAR